MILFIFEGKANKNYCTNMPLKDNHKSVPYVFLIVQMMKKIVFLHLFHFFFVYLQQNNH